MQWYVILIKKRLLVYVKIDSVLCLQEVDGMHWLRKAEDVIGVICISHARGCKCTYGIYYFEDWFSTVAGDIGVHADLFVLTFNCRKRHAKR